MKAQKSEAAAESDRLETKELIQKIIQATETIPVRVMNETSYQAAVNFKQQAITARKVAESKQPRLSRLREAWQSISGYYA